MLDKVRMKVRLRNAFGPFAPKRNVNTCHDNKRRPMQARTLSPPCRAQAKLKCSISHTSLARLGVVCTLLPLVSPDPFLALFPTVGALVVSLTRR